MLSNISIIMSTKSIKYLMENWRRLKSYNFYIERLNSHNLNFKLQNCTDIKSKGSNYYAFYKIFFLPQSFKLISNQLKVEGFSEKKKTSVTFFHLLCNNCFLFLYKSSSHKIDLKAFVNKITSDKKNHISHHNILFSNKKTKVQHKPIKLQKLKGVGH